MAKLARSLKKRKKGGGNAHRYWRFAAAAGAAGDSWQTNAGTGYQDYYTLSFFSSTDGTGTDLALFKTATASTFFNASYLPSNAVDNNSGTRWASVTGTNRQWIAVDCGVPVEVHSAKIFPFTASNVPYVAKNILLQWSDDGTNWTTQTTIATANLPNVTQTFTNL